MSRATLFEPFALTCLKRIGILALVASGVLLLIGREVAALGVVLGACLFAVNLLLLYEAGRSLLAASSTGLGKAMAAGSSVARFLMMGVALWLIASYLGREALLAACGSLFLSQVHLRLPVWRSSEAI